jgi:P27 family predicted phage terminase small subunit
MSAKKPASRRQGKSGTTKDVGVVKLASVGKIPAAPRANGKPLLKVVRDAWEEFWLTHELAGLVKPADRAALDRLFRNYDLRERLERIFRKKPFVTGSTGQDVINPAAKEIGSLDGRIVAAEDRFGITPLARMKLGIAFGDAARSLDGINEEFDRDDEDSDDEDDPRLKAAIDI